MTKLRDVIPEDERERWEAMSEKEREIERQKSQQQINDVVARLAEAPTDAIDGLAKKIAGLHDAINTPILSPFDRGREGPEKPRGYNFPEIKSPFPGIVDVLQDLAAEQKKTTGELAKANRAGKVVGRIAKWALFVAALALLTNVLPAQDWIARIW